MTGNDIGSDPPQRHQYVSTRGKVLLGLLAAFVVVAFIADGLLGDDDGSSTPDVISWFINLPSDPRTSIRLTGELPNGYPTATYVDGELVDRDPEGDFAWDTSARLPAPVSAQRAMTCTELVADVELWLSQANAAAARDVLARAAAFAQNGVNLQASKGC